MIKLIELFAGVGTQLASFREAFGEEVESIGISEIDSKPLKGYTALFGTPKNFGDITKIASLPEADVWTYSFPCTDLSIAGKKDGFSGKNSSLIFQVYRLLLSSPKPRFLLMENVANICNEKFMPEFQSWIDSLSELGYTSYWKKMKASDYGGATIRERVFMISVLNNKVTYTFPEKEISNLTIGDYLSSEEEDAPFVVDTSSIKDVNTFNYTKVIKLADYNNGGQGNRIYSIKGKGVTLTATGGGKAGSSGGLYLRNGKIYKLSPLEMCRVMGWSDEEATTLCNSMTARELGFCMGNAIDKVVLTKIVRNLKI